MRMFRYFGLLLPALFFSCSSGKQEADLIIHHARIYAVDTAFSSYEAMAVRNGTILELGSNLEILGKYEAGVTRDAGGKAVFPGFIDAHCHFTGYATDMWKCHLNGTRSFGEVLERIQAYSEQAPMYWIYGRGWDQNDWEEKEFPDKTRLDALFPDRPVFLKRIDGHAALANQKALDLSGITARTRVDGGLVEVKQGIMTGMLLDNAMDLVDHRIPSVSDSLAKLYYTRAQEICFSYGLTQVHDCGVSNTTVRLLRESQDAGALKMKVVAFLSNDPANYETWLRQGPLRTERLSIAGFKLYADGALGSRGACLLKPYHDQAGWSGFLLSSPEALEKTVQTLADSPFQLCTHAIGDSANRQMLKLYAAALKGKNDRRWRIEHAQVVDASDLAFFGQYDIIPSVQPTHATSDMYWAGERLGGGRIRQAYAYQQLLKSAGRIALGTDFPVEAISPLNTFFAAVARQDSSGYPEQGFAAEQALSRADALRGMTAWAAHAGFYEKEKGSLEKRKAADFIILDTDLMTCPVRDILRARVLATYIDGEAVFERQESAMDQKPSQ
jgi:predicted amidohydrolase YtcJ